jgi:predicted double-glycine peptidase
MNNYYYPKVILPVCRNLQDTNYDCGPASLEIVLNSLGIEISEERLIRLAKADPEEGTPPERLTKALDELGVKYELIEPAGVDILEEKIRNLNLCLVDYQAFGEGGADYKNLGTGHYSVVFGYDQTQYWVADPAMHHVESRKKWGARKIRKDLFVEHWKDREADGNKTYHLMIAVPLGQKR